MVKVDEKELQKLKEMVSAEKNLNACAKLYDKLYEHPGIFSSRDEVGQYINSLRNGGNAEKKEADRLELVLKNNSKATYFDYYTEQPVTFKWLRNRLGMGKVADKDANLLTFLQNGNIVRIRDNNEYAAFLRVLTRHGLGSLVVPRLTLYEDVVALYKLRQNALRHPNWDGKTLYAECLNEKEPIGIYPEDGRIALIWYGVEPLSVDDIDG